MLREREDETVLGERCEQEPFSLLGWAGSRIPNQFPGVLSIFRKDRMGELVGRTLQRIWRLHLVHLSLRVLGQQAGGFWVWSGGHWAALGGRMVDVPRLERGLVLLRVYTQPSGLLADELGFLESLGLTSFLPNNVSSGFEIRSQH